MGLDGHASGLPLRVGLQLLELRHHQDGLQELVQVLPGLRRDVHELMVAPPLRWLDARLRELSPHPHGVRLRLVDLVHGHHDGYAGGPGMVQRLDRLRHDPIVGGHDQHGDVRDLGATGPHGGERLVARRIDERDHLGVLANLVGPDVLGDPARLPRDHVGLPDGIEKEGLPVVHVAHHGDHRRPRAEARGIEVLVLLFLYLFLRSHDLHLAAVFTGEQLDGFVGERLRDGHHLAELQHLSDDLGGLRAELLRDLLCGGPPGDLDRLARKLRVRLGLGLRLGGRLGLGFRPRRPSSLRFPPPRPGGKRLLRHDAGLAGGNGLAARGPQPGNRFIRRAGGSRQSLVSHLLQDVDEVAALDPQLLGQFVDPHSFSSVRCLRQRPSARGNAAA
jgi:hypothetical protein